MDTPEEPGDKLPSCSCYNPNRRPCQYEVLYDEALCQVESLQRQVRHLRTEMRRVEDENAALTQQINKHSSEPQPDVSQLKIKHENEMKKREESWQRELQRWRKKFQIRDTEIMTLKARITELEGESRKSTTCKAVQAEVKCGLDVVPASGEITLHQKNDSLSSSKITTKCSNAIATDKSYEDIMDELFGASPKPDTHENTDVGKNSELFERGTKSKCTKVKEQAKKAISKSSTKDEVQGVSVACVKKNVEACSTEPLKITKLSVAKSGVATVNKDIPKSSSSKTSVPCLGGQKTSEAKARDVDRNVFEKIKMHSKESIKDAESDVGASSLCHGEKQSAAKEKELCNGGKKNFTSAKDVIKLPPVGPKVRKSGGPKNISLLPDIYKSNKVEPEQQKIGSTENLKTLNVAVDRTSKRKVLEAGVSVDMKEQNTQKRNKSSSADKKQEKVEKVEQKTMVLGDGLPSSDSNDKPISNKKIFPCDAARKDNKQSRTSKTAVEGKPEVVKTSRVCNEQHLPVSKMNKKSVNLSDLERVKAYMNLANRIDSEKRQSSQPRKGKSSNSPPHQNCVSPSLSSDFDDSRHVNEASSEYQPSGSCYSPSVLPVKEDEYDPFNPGIDVFPMSKYSIKKGEFSATKKYPVLQPSVLRIGSKPETNKDEGKVAKPSDIQEEYSPTSISRTDSEEQPIEPVEYIPSSTLYPHKKDSPWSSPVLSRPPPTSQITPETKATKVHPSASSTACSSLQTNVPNQDHLMPLSKPSSLNKSHHQKSLPPAVQVTSNPTNESKRSDINKPPNNAFKESSVTSKSHVVLPQLNLSCIGDSLLSGVREALNMVKTLSPQLSGQVDDPAVKSMSSSSEEQQPPSFQSKKKDVPVLMPSPLKKPPKNNEKQVLRAKILSSIQLDDGNCRESSYQKCPNDRVSQSGRLWRKRKRATTAEPKSILKKSRIVTGDDVDGEEYESCPCNRELLSSGQNVRISSSADASSVQTAANHSAAEEVCEESNNSRQPEQLLNEARLSAAGNSKCNQRSRSEGFCRKTPLNTGDRETVHSKLSKTAVSKMQQHDKGDMSMYVSNDIAGSKIVEPMKVDNLIYHPEKPAAIRPELLHHDAIEMQASTDEHPESDHMTVTKSDKGTLEKSLRSNLGNCFRNQSFSRPYDSNDEKLFNKKMENEQFSNVICHNSSDCELMQHPQQCNPDGKTSWEKSSNNADKDETKCQSTVGRVNIIMGDEKEYCGEKYLLTAHTEGKACDDVSDCAPVRVPRNVPTEVMDTSVTTLELSGDNWINDMSVSSSATSGSSHLAADDLGYFEVESTSQTACDHDGENSAMESGEVVYDNNNDDMPTVIADSNTNEIDVKNTTSVVNEMSEDTKDQLGSTNNNSDQQSPVMSHGSEKSKSRQFSHGSTGPDVGGKPNTSEEVMLKHSGTDKKECLSPVGRNGTNDESFSRHLNGTSDPCGEVGSVVGPFLGLGGTVSGQDLSSQLEKVVIKQEVCNSDDDCCKVRHVQELREQCGSTSSASIIVLSDDDSSSPTSSSGSSSPSSCMSSEEESESGNPVSGGDQVEQSSSGSDGEERTSSECQVNNPDDSSSGGQSASNGNTSENSAASSCDDEKESGIEQMDSEPEEVMDGEQTGGQYESSSCCEFESSSSSSSCSSCCDSESGSCVGSDVEGNRADPDQLTEGTTSVHDTDSSENKASADTASLVSDSSEHGSRSDDDVSAELKTSHDEDVIDLFIEPDNDFEIGSIRDGKLKTNQSKSERRLLPQKFGDGLQDGLFSCASRRAIGDEQQKGTRPTSDGNRSASGVKYSSKKTVNKEIDGLATTKEQHRIDAGVSQPRSAENERSRSKSDRPYYTDQLPTSDARRRSGADVERKPSVQERYNDRSGTHKTSSRHSDTDRSRRYGQCQSNSRIRR